MEDLGDLKSISLASPHSSIDSSMDKPAFHQLRATDHVLLTKLLNAVKDIDKIITTKLELIESLDISMSIATYKVYEITYEFKEKINEIKEERNKLLMGVGNRSELSLIINDLDRKILDLQAEHDFKVADLNGQKIEFQEQIEELMTHLDEDIVTMQTNLAELKQALEVEKGASYRSQIILINEKYNLAVQELEDHLSNYGKIQLTGWKVEHSDMKLAEILEERGLRFTPSGRLLTRTGSLITFQEAQEKGYLKDINVSLDRITEFFKERERQRERELSQEQQAAAPSDVDVLTEDTSIRSKMSSEDVKYLKQYVGKPLTLALAEITTIQPRDPIHYLGHYLFKYRYNQELEEIQKKEIEEFTAERKKLAEERWKKFVEDEARDVVIRMVLQAEELAYQNELKRIEQEQLMAEEENENEEEETKAENQIEKELLEEAKDKFE